MWYLKICCCTCKRPPWISTPYLIQPTPDSAKVRFHSNIPSVPRSVKWPLSSGFYARILYVSLRAHLSCHAVLFADLKIIVFSVTASPCMNIFCSATCRCLCTDGAFVIKLQFLRISVYMLSVSFA